MAELELHERIVYRAFGVSDLIAAENQPKAAAASLLRAAGIEVDDSNRREAYQRVGLAFVASLVEMLRSHELDPVLGEYRDGWRDSAELARELLNSAHRRLLEGRTGSPPEEEARALSKAAVERLSEWARSNPDALHDLSGSGFTPLA